MKLTLLIHEDGLRWRYRPAKALDHTPAEFQLCQLLLHPWPNNQRTKTSHHE